MNALVLFMIMVVTTGDYLVELGWLPRALKLLPELVSGLVVMQVFLRGPRTGFQFVRPAYLLVFGAMAVIMACGAASNALEAGPLVAGLRSYLRAVPLFFLPAVYSFDDRKLRSQLVLLLVICVMQLPLVVDQRLASLALGNPSGDDAVGTLETTGFASVFLICVGCVLAGMVQRRQIGVKVFATLFLLVLVTTAVNETKASFLLAPVGLMVTFLVGARAGTRLRNAVVAICLLAAVGAVLVPIYDYFGVMRQSGGGRMVDYVTDTRKVKGYMYAEPTKDSTSAGRATSIARSFEEMSKDPTRVAFGYGIGNTSQSSLGQQFVGKYNSILGPYLNTLVTVFMFEIGILGLFLSLLVCYLVFQDSQVVADSGRGALCGFAAGWAGVAVVIAIATFYNVHFASPAISYLFWYGSGLVAAHRMRLTRARQAETSNG